MRTVWMMIILGLVVSTAGVVSAEEVEDTKKSHIPLYDGKPGDKIGDVRINPKDGAKMLWVTAGEFLMGSTDEQVAAELKELELRYLRVWSLEALFSIPAEKPQRKVYLDGYWIYKYPVTVAQYRKFCKSTGSNMPEPPEWGWIDDHPIVNVRWQHAAAYAEWAGVSLPTEAQWEKAARGTDGRIYPWGNEWDAAKCANSVDKKLSSTQPIGSCPPGTSPYGAMDMSGNVWEWCADWFDPDYYESAPTRNPTGPSASVESTMPLILNYARVLRGGSWSSWHSYNFRCARRYSTGRTWLRNNTGFRCAGTP